MRLFLAVAVLMLAFVAYTEAQEEPTLEQKFAAFTNQMTEGVRNLGERVKTGFEDFRNSDAAQTSTNWLNEKLESFKEFFKPQ